MSDNFMMKKGTFRKRGQLKKKSVINSVIMKKSS